MRQLGLWEKRNLPIGEHGEGAGLSGGTRTRTNTDNDTDTDANIAFRACKCVWRACLFIVGRS